ncbi:hypothetical protein AWC38_SpisGene2605 [Stylophora pistillata]|uniref:Uncharacterized protein n=1 Tax=Stylophora pistillata TaxID=50429 RepID=A0A2B4SUN3_STYPI|nr:hypothetical protein AWC38_SpisGene2605 [Stylophora pistillata]
MASWVHLEEKSNESRLPPLQQKSRISVRVTYLRSDCVRSCSLKDEGDKKERLQKGLEGKVQNKRSSRIPVIIDEKRTKVDTKVVLLREKNLQEEIRVCFLTVSQPYFVIQTLPRIMKRSQKIAIGINLRETQGKQEKKKESAIPLTTASYGKYCRRAKETTPNDRRRVPRQLAPIETGAKEVCNDEKEPREESSASEVSSAAEVTPDFECNAAPVHEEELRIGTEADFSGSEFGDDFERLSKSSDEKAMPNVPPWLRDDYKSFPEDASDETKKEPKGKAMYNPLETPKDNCIYFVSDELDKIIAEMSVMNADMTDGEHADAMSTLQLLRDEAR